MSFKLPRHFASQHREANVEALNHELLQESAETLGRLGRRMERALAALAAFDAAGGPDAAERDALVAAAGEAVWYYVVQREVMGLRDAEMLLRELGVPREVRLRMGVAPRRTNDRASP